MSPWIGVPYVAVAGLYDIALGLLLLAASPSWPLVVLAGWATKNHTPLSAEWRLERRIHRAERASTLTEMRRKAEAAEASARRTFEAYIQSETP